MEWIEIETPRGLARAHAQPAAEPRGALVIGHGAGGGVSAPDITAAAAAAAREQLSVALVEQPYRVAGRRAPAPAPQLDEAWLAVIDRLRADELAGLPLIAAGRSMGARVACRTASAAGAVGVLCLAFPLHPPGRAADPSKSRLFELDQVSVPTLVVQGESDPFGMPPAAAQRTVVVLPGDHSLRKDLKGVGAAVDDWLSRLLPR